MAPLTYRAKTNDAAAGPARELCIGAIAMMILPQGLLENSVQVPLVHAAGWAMTGVNGMEEALWRIWSLDSQWSRSLVCRLASIRAVL